MNKNSTEENEKPPGQKPHQITVIFNRVGQRREGLAIDQLADMDTLTTAIDIAKGLKKIGYAVDLFDVKPSNFESLPFYPTDLFFNSCFGIGNIPKSEYQIPQILDHNQKPYTGGDANNILLTTDKYAAKQILKENGLPTALAKIFEHPGESLPHYLKFPLMVKPSQQDASQGISNKSIVTNRQELNQRIAFINKWYREPALVEEFIDGREINAAILGNDKDLTVLPISEIVFGESFQKKEHGQKRWPIVSFAAKWLKNTTVYKETAGVCPTLLPRDLEDKIKELAKKAYQLMNCRDFARVDFRLKDDGSIYILEVNANPAIDNDPSVGLVRSAKAFGLDYSSLLDRIVCQAWKRTQETPQASICKTNKNERSVFTQPQDFLRT